MLLTTGRQDADAFAGIDSAWFLIRVVDPPTGPLPPHHRIVRSRGPGLDDERTLMADEKIDLLVTKNSGGRLTRAEADRGQELGIPVVMVARPVEPCGNVVTSVESRQLRPKMGRSADMPSDSRFAAELGQTS